MQGKVFTRYKVGQLKGAGIAITGRGMAKTFDRIHESAEKLSLNCFDDYLPYWPEIVKKAHEDRLLSIMGRDELPFGATLDEVLDRILSSDPEKTRMLNRVLFIDLFIVGYSHKKKAMGLVDMQTGRKKDGFIAQESYSKGLVFFMETEPIRELIKKKGRYPKTDKDMVEGLRLVSKSMRDRLSKEEPEFLKILPCGGNIQKTTVYKNGTFSVQRVAPFEKKEKRSAPLRIVS